MPVRYFGPECLQKTVESSYDSLKHHYERKDPTIVVGLPQKVDFAPEKTNIRMDRSFTRTIDESFDQFNHNLPFKQFAAQLRNFDYACFRANAAELETSRYYLLAIDTIVLNTKAVFYVSCPNFFNNLGTDVRPIDIIEFDKDMKHELIHWDLGNTDPIVKYRELLKASPYGQVDWTQLIKSGGSIDPTQLTDGQKQEILTFSVDQNSATKELLAQISNLSTSGLRIIDEALAYAPDRENPDFTTYTNDPEFLAQFKTAHAYFRRRLGNEPLAKVIREVKQAINHAFETDQHIFEVLSIRS